ncbi:MAG: hypothetical protein HYX20_01915 [Candidatus Yanofskybacteria bacterium]|nr:hypothetical protein [Candidatus Yanofskybacteria bacterium]
MTKLFGTGDLREQFPYQLRGIPGLVLEPLVHLIFNKWLISLSESKFDDPNTTGDVTDFEERVEGFICVVLGKIVRVEYQKDCFLNHGDHKYQSFIYQINFDGKVQGLNILIKNLKGFIKQTGLENLRKQAGRQLITDCTCERHQEVYNFYSVSSNLPCA